MKRGIIALLTGLAFGATVLAASSAKKATPIVHWKTQTGVPVYFVASHELPMVDVRWLFKAGSAYDGEHPGLSEFTLDVLEEGAAGHDASAIAEAFDTVGAQFSHRASRDATSLSLRTLSDPAHLQPALTTFTEVFSQPMFTRKSVERLRGQLLTHIRLSHQDPGVVARERFMSALYGSHPYAHPGIGTLASIKAISAEQLRQFHHRFYVRENARLLLVGDLTLAQAKQLSERLSKALTSGQPAPVLPALAAPKAESVPKTVRVPFASSQTGIVIGLLGIRRSNPDYFPLMVGNAVFGGYGLTSILFKEVRSKKGLAYRVVSGFSALQQRGPFMVSLNTRGSKAEEAERLVKKLLKHYVEQGPTEQQLKATKQFMIGSFPLSVANNSQMLESLSQIALYHLPLDYLSTYTQKVAAVTGADVRRAFQKAINPGHLVTVTVGHEK